MTDIALTLRNEIQMALSKQPDPIEFAATVVPQLEIALEYSQTTDEVNGIRASIDMVSSYCWRALPRIVQERTERLKKMYPAEMAYVKASGKAGVLYKLENSLPGENWHKAGFMSSRDATTCIRIGELIAKGDLETYFEVTKENNRHITLGGAENVWRELYKEKDDDTKPTPIERLKKAEEILVGLIHDVEGDVQILVRQAHRMVMDAVEIERDNTTRSQ